MRCQARIVSLVILGMLVVMTTFVHPVNAQENKLRIAITQVDGSAFPLVTAYVSITDNNGQPVVGLTQGEFTMTEDGKPVAIVKFTGSGVAALNTLLILDHSGSMQGPKLTGAQAAASSFVDLMRAQDQTGLLVFDQGTLLAQPLTSDKNALRQSIGAIQVGGGTALYDAIWSGVDLLKPLSGRKSAIVLSDGMDNKDGWLGWLNGGGSQHSLDEVVNHAGTSNLPLYTIGLGDASQLNETALKRLAEQTGGAYYHAPNAADLAALYKTLSRQLQAEYMLTYHSPRPAYDGTRRGIQIMLKSSAGLIGTSEGTYIEQHLLQLRSSWLPGTVLLGLLVAALGAPLILRRIGRSRTKMTSGTTLSLPQSPPIPTATPTQPASSVTQNRICRFCGAALRPTARFCTSCGRDQTAA